MIPPFDKNNVLPPYLGPTPADKVQQSPYKSNIVEVCQHFAKTSARIEILKGLVQFRMDCVANGIGAGIQWLDGSFMENVEVSQSRDPNDIDVVSLIHRKSPAEESLIASNFPAFCTPTQSKFLYKVDHYFFYFDLTPQLTIDGTKYWVQLFGHNRLGIRKGMLEIQLFDNPAMDVVAMNYLNSLKP